ncbi:glycosyltransferase family 4 protein [Paenibacillus sp. 11B]|uniref:glycosyltransferase family 4 protein n=1 Tax=Paenibacillus sp. 11B TaxID=3060965 RepID=UPI0026505B27|nr:glycosyltransferase family 4 protein [Paenibacillus sp. 11B]MDN8590295.1 glycosyltransferase family 4 protein [Paenibacillus sp. 11B]
MVKILIAHSLYPPNIIGGAEVSTQILAQTLGRRYEVQVMTVGQHNDKRIRSDRVNGIEVFRLPYNNQYWVGDIGRRLSVASKIMWRVQDIFNVKQYRHIKELLVRERPDLVHTQNLPGISLAVWRAAREQGIPVVHTLRDYSLIEPINISMYSKIYRVFSRKSSQTISSVIGISSHILDSHTGIGFFEDSSKHIIHNIVEMDASSVRLYEQKKVNVNAPLHIGYFGQLTEVKGVQYLIEAFRGLGHDIADRLHIFGEGPSLYSLQQSAAPDKRIEFKGKIDKSEIARQMAAMDLVIVPSIWGEPFGRVVIESYQVGTPVYASHVGGMVEILLDTDEFSFESQSSEAIRHSILHYYHMSAEEKERLKHRCYYHSQTFNESYLLQNHADIYDKLIRHGG